MDAKGSRPVPGGPGKRLAALLRESGPFDLVRAALTVATGRRPELDVDREAARLEAMGREAARRADRLANPFARLDAVTSYLFDELRYQGGDEDEPRNVYLSEVLERRTGGAIGLTVVFLAAARPAGFDARGLDLPGTCAARVTYGGRTVFVDPHGGGRVITEEDCRRLVGRATGRPGQFKREQLVGEEDRGILRRMLAQLKQIHLGREEFAPALSMVEHLLLLSPEDPQEIRDRGFLLAHLGRPGAAVADLETYLTLEPAAPDAASVRGRLAWLRRRLTETN